MSDMTPAAVMEMEHAHPARADDGRKESAVRAAFGVSMIRYAQRLNGLLDDPAFVTLDPIMARILRSRRERGRRSVSCYPG